jgi:hypothetical protein
MREDLKEDDDDSQRLIVSDQLIRTALSFIEKQP